MFKAWILGTIVLVVTVVVSSSAWASPTYGPTMPKKKQAVWGLQYHYIGDRNLDNDLGSVRSHQNYMTLYYGLTDWFSVDLKWSLYSTFRYEPQSGKDLNYNTPVWGGGYGFRVRLYENGPLKVVSGFEHFSIHPLTIREDGQKHNGILEDWQESLIVSYDLKSFVPYAGVRYDLLDYIHRYNDGDRNRINSDGNRRIGLITGLDIPLGKRVWINLEGDWQESGSATAGVHCRF